MSKETDLMANTEKYNENKEKSDWQKRDIGALWKQVSRSGSNMKYLSGHIKLGEDEFGVEKKMKIMVFTNDKKTENQPDFRIYLNEQAQEGEDSGSSSEGSNEMETANAAASEEEGIL
jgi:uncharacterized protein (DUF736 family)